jgi:hypothetical protein
VGLPAPAGGPHCAGGQEIPERQPSSEVGHCASHHKEGVEDFHLLHEEGGFRPYATEALAPLFPSCLLHAEADLKPKDFKEATLRTNVAGACGLALVCCGETAFSALGKESDVMTHLRNAISGDSPQDVESLLSTLRETHEDLSHPQGSWQDCQHGLKNYRWFF